MKPWTETVVKISEAAYKARGDFYGTARALGRFCTESLVAVAEDAMADMTAAEKAKYGPHRSGMPNARDNAVWVMCSWVHAVRMREFVNMMDRAKAAATAEFPAAFEALGANLGA